MCSVSVYKHTPGIKFLLLGQFCFCIVARQKAVLSTVVSYCKATQGQLTLQRYLPEDLSLTSALEILLKARFNFLARELS